MACSKIIPRSCDRCKRWSVYYQLPLFSRVGSVRQNSGCFPEKVQCRRPHWADEPNGDGINLSLKPKEQWRNLSFQGTVKVQSLAHCELGRLKSFSRPFHQFEIELKMFPVLISLTIFWPLDFFSPSERRSDEKKNIFSHFFSPHCSVKHFDSDRATMEKCQILREMWGKKCCRLDKLFLDKLWFFSVPFLKQTNF